MISSTEECYAFADFRLFPRQRTLLAGDEVVQIGGRQFDVLLSLVSRAGQVVSSGELMSAVWPNVTVEDANLRVQIGNLRKTLSQHRDGQRAIETVSLRGYCFVLPVLHHKNELVRPGDPRAAGNPLPPLISPIIGRDDAIVLTAKALDDHRLVTVTGPGGIGKTTLAVATGHRCADRFADVVAFADLSHANNGTDAAMVIVSALGLEVHGDARPALCNYLQTRAALLVLDTCEHIVEPVAALAEMLLARCAQVRLVVTSREALRVAGEWVHRLPSLTFPDDAEELSRDNLATFTAITLFVDRVQSSMRFEVEDGDLPALGEICRRLDGIPLALEFAAARVVDLGLRDLAAHLDDHRFSVLTRGRRNALSRHRTLSAMLDWSYNLLSHDEQRMLRHLGTLGASFTAEGALSAGSYAGCERPPETFAALFEKSLISVDGSKDAPTYRLLDTTRAYLTDVATV